MRTNLGLPRTSQGQEKDLRRAARTASTIRLKKTNSTFLVGSTVSVWPVYVEQYSSHMLRLRKKPAPPYSITKWT